MLVARQWKPAEDETIKRMKANGFSWGAISKELGISRNIIIERGRRLHAFDLTTRPIIEKIEPRNGKDALRAGHPLTWGLIADYPYPKL